MPKTVIPTYRKRLAKEKGAILKDRGGKIAVALIGTVIIGEGVKISRVAISHGDLTLKVGTETAKKKDADKVVVVDESANVGDIVKAMNRIGVTPKDLITILESIKAAGALHGDLEVL